ncbi:MAG: SAM-dependent methyltransferase [Fibrobacteres bacterium]|nr:SAM-dependent methyltransferase [Fibrobacterota bacterium]
MDAAERDVARIMESLKSWKPSPAPGHASYSGFAGLVESAPGRLTQAQGRLLFEKVQSLPDDARILEIGCDGCRSTLAMAFACAGTGKRIFAIDPFERERPEHPGQGNMLDTLAEWRGILAGHGLEAYAEPIKGHGFDVLSAWQGPPRFDLVLMGGAPGYVDLARNLRLAYPMVPAGGWMAIRDAEPENPGPWRAWLEYGRALLSDHETSGSLACGRTGPDRPLHRADREHADFSFAREYMLHLADASGKGAAALAEAMKRSLEGRYGTEAEREHVHSAEIALGTGDGDPVFRVTLRSMLSREARTDGHLLLWNAMTLMGEARWEDAYRYLLESTRVSRPVPVERIREYCAVLRENLGDAAAKLPEPGAPNFGSVAADVTGGASGSGHYGQDYFNWQKRIGAFGGVANLFKFREFIRPSDTVIDLGSGGGFLLGNVRCARKMGVEINPSARRDAALFAGIDTVERPEDLPDSFADIVISNHALEHMHSPLEVLRTLLPKLKPGARLVLVVPNDPPQQEWDPGDINKHLFTWNPMTLGNLVALAGYKVQKVEAIQHQWPPNFTEVYASLGEEGFHQACRDQAKRTGTYQIRVVAVR